MLRAHVQSSLQTVNLTCLLLDFLVFNIPKSMFMLINAVMIPERRERAKTDLFDFVCHVCCGS